jgi:nucleoprotein TPR
MLTGLETARLKLESEIEQIKSASTNDASETASLKSRISSLEAANRDTLAVLDSKSRAYDKLAEDLAAQHQKSVELRRQVSTLEQNLQAANSAAATMRFKESSLEQELELMRRNNEWFEAELKTKSAEHLKFRKDKGARITELQRLNEQYISEAEALRRSEAALRSRLDDQLQKFEESLAEIQQLKEDRIQDAETFRADLESSARLAELQKQSADTARQRAQELSIALEEAKEDAAEELGRIRAEVDTEHSDRVAAEARVSELEAIIARLESNLEQSQAQPTTPQRGMNGHGSLTPNRPGTPTGIFSPASASRLKGNLSMTQMYAEYKKVEKDLATERRTNEQLSATLEDVVRELESNKPEIDELRNDHAKLQTELLEMSSLMDTAHKERDAAVKEVRRLQGHAESLNRETELLQQQVRDLSSQVKVLLMEQHIRESGQQYSDEEMLQLQQTARVDTATLADMSDTGRVISENLVTFRNLAELQERNTQILRMLRQLGEQLESNEAREKEQVHQKEHEELEALRVRVASYKDELQSMVAQSQSYVKERDMFRNMLTRRGHFPSQVEPGSFAQSMPLPAGSPPRGLMDSIHGGSAAGDETDYAKLLRDLQTHFDSYKTESASNHAALGTQITELSKRNSELQKEASKALSQLSAANQRCEMLLTNFNMLKDENAQIQKQSYANMENATKQELKTQQIAEELVELRGLLDSTRRESANLKAEKELSKSVQERLIQDNESLRNERGRLDQLNATLQNILNEREQTDSETRRRLQSQTESLEAELQATKRKLNEEIEEGKKVTLRKDYELSQLQTRINDLLASLGSVREELAATKTARDHLQARVDEMTVELRSAEERLEVLQSHPATGPSNQPQTADENALSREQELAVEVSELRRDLELKQAELDRANEQIETYKSISQSSEERLQELTDTNDQYREETDRALAEKDKRLGELEQTIEDITSELTTTNNELSKLRDEQSESNRRLEEQKATYEAEVARLKDLEESSAEQAQFNLEASKAQAEIAQQAQQNYENELLKHAEAARALQTVRSEANQLRLEMTDLKTQAHSANISLAQKEESFAAQKDQYERELADLRKRREEVVQQNAHLHSQLESLTKQIGDLQRDRSQLAQTETGETTAPGLDDLQEVIKYLRREKEIVDVQYHLSTQETKRLRQQLDHVQSQYDETRLKLDQQLRTEADSERNMMNHNKLMETLNELNLFRESSVTLRAEAKQALTALAEKTQRVTELQAEIEPLKTRISELENHAELREGEMKLLQEDRDHWRQRTQTILSKHDRVDPAELEALKEKVSALEAERDEALSARGTLQTQVDSFPEQIEAQRQELRGRLGEQFKARSKELTGRIKDKQTELDAVNSEKDALQTELDAVRLQLDTMKAQVAQASAEVNGVRDEVPPTESTSSTNNQDLSGRVVELEGKVAELEAAVAEKDQQIASLMAQHEERYRAREAELKAVLNKRLQDFKTEAQTARANALKELEDRLKTEHQQELDAIKATQPPAEAGEVQQQTPVALSETTQEQAPKQNTDSELPELTEAQARALIQKNEVVRNILRINIKRAVDKEKDSFRKELEAAASAGGEKPSQGQLAELEARFITEKETLTKELDEKYATERENLIRQHQEKLASERQSLIIENAEKLSSERVAFSKEAEKKIADQVALAEKRLSVKLNMAENRARTAGAKLEVVKQAATETPQKPVVEVWEVAKDAKPAPVAAQPKPAAVAPPKPVSTSEAQGTPSVAEPASAPEADQTKPPDGDAEPKPTQPQLAQPSGQAESHAPASAIPKPAQTNHVGTGPAALRQLGQSGIARGGSFRGRGGAVGTSHAQQGSTATESQQQQPSNRGSGIPRGGGGGGRGRGQGRGGAQNIQTNNLPQASAQGQPAPSAGNPRGGGLNPTARQFNPQGSKRPREDGEVGDPSNIGKRIRGGGGGN